MDRIMGGEGLRFCGKRRADSDEIEKKILEKLVGKTIDLHMLLRIAENYHDQCSADEKEKKDRFSNIISNIKRGINCVKRGETFSHSNICQIRDCIIALLTAEQEERISPAFKALSFVDSGGCYLTSQNTELVVFSPRKIDIKPLEVEITNQGRSYPITFHVKTWGLVERVEEDWMSLSYVGGYKFINGVLTIKFPPQAVAPIRARSSRQGGKRSRPARHASPVARCSAIR
mgnify:CR=1 FL=1